MVGPPALSVAKGSLRVRASGGHAGSLAVELVGCGKVKTPDIWDHHRQIAIEVPCQTSPCCKKHRTVQCHWRSIRDVTISLTSHGRLTNER
jgi:hypothetical protein